jgi:uncharacterized protein YbjT (DUF2867 family)
MMQASTKFAVVGATGRLGTHLVDLLREAGHEVVPMSRSQGVDVTTGDGLAEALEGVDIVIDASSNPTPDQQEATDFFTKSARNLQTVGQEAGVKRLVAASIIGVDAFDTGYNVAKLVQERTLSEGPLPVRILRASQFHEFIPVVLDWGRQGDVAYVWPMRTQPVAARTAAEALVDLALDPSDPGDGPLPEIAGPREERLVELARLLEPQLRIEEQAEGDDPTFELYADGTLLPSPHATLAGPTFAEWLKSR